MAGILTEAAKLAALTEDISNAYGLELSRVLRALERELALLAMDAQANAPTALMRAVRAGRMRKQVRDALAKAGFPELTDRYSDTRLDAVVIQVERLRGAAQLAAFVEADGSRVTAIKALVKLDILGQGEVIAQAVWKTLAQGIFTKRPIAALLQDIATTLDAQASTARRIYDTSVNIFHRQIEAMKASGERDEPFAYMGPVDEKTREFCLERAGKVFTRAEVDGMDNGQISNVFLTGGGWNCRHAFVAVSKYGEAGRLVGTGERLPEVAAQYEAMAA